MPKTIGPTRASGREPPATNAFQHIRYLASAVEPQQLPPDRGAEVAFVGRSNAGKSSAINAICARRKLAFVSRTPGRTQMINFFALGEGTCLVDLPGYGYAKVPAEIRDRWQNLLGFYLTRRAALRGLLIVVDARHGITALDEGMVQWFAPSGKPIHILPLTGDSPRFDRLHKGFIKRGAARWFDGTLESWAYPPIREAARAADGIVRLMLQKHPPAGSAPVADV